MEFYTEFWEQNDYLKKVKIALENECTFCRQNVQTIKHLFAECRSVITLWENLKDWILKRIGVDFHFG